MNVTLSRALFLAGSRHRNPSLDSQQRFLLETEWLPASQLRQVQFDRLKAFLTHVAAKSPYYRKLFSGIGFSPTDLSSVTQLSEIPVTTKATLIRNNAEVHTPSHQGRYFLAETSGTSGSALEFRKSELWDSTVRAHMYRSYDWYGVRPWERNGYLWGYNIAPSQAKKVAMLDALQNRFRLFSYDRHAVLRFAEQLASAAFISGYSSMIHEVAKVMLEEGLDTVPLKLVKGTSETILDAYRDSSKRAFNRTITSEYGSAESGLIAFECPSGSMHINVESVVLEVGDEGDAIVTNLVSHSFPIVRYSLGDAIRLSDSYCACGRQHPILAEVAGRRGGIVFGLTRSFPALTFYYVFKNIALQDKMLLNYRAVQETRGSCRVLIEGEDSQDVRSAVHREAVKYFGNDLSINLEFVSGMPVGGRKAQYFTTMLDS